MKIAILCVGTRGDVQPNLALAKALLARGHEVVLGAPDNFQGWVEGHGVRFHPMGVDMQALMQDPELKKLIDGSWFAYPKVWKTIVRPMMEKSLQATWEAAKDADIILFHPKVNAALDVAEATGAKAIYATPIPAFATGAFPIFNFLPDLGPWFNRQTYKMMMLGRLLFRGTYNKWRRETLGLGKSPWFVPIEGYGPILCAVSLAVLKLLPEEYERIHMTGYWFFDENANWAPDDGLQAFLDAGEPPVYIGFGSMSSMDPELVTRNVIQGVESAGVRAILATGWGGLEAIEVPDSIYVIESAPHDALFKRVSAVVHHGGAGSTAAGLRAGKPTLICPLAVDQPFWGNRVHELGCGPKPLHQKKLTGDKFGDRLRDLVTNEGYKFRALEVAEDIALEDGVGEAVKIIEHYKSTE